MGGSVVLTFGNHRLDLARRELRHGGEQVALEPRAFDLLAFLIENRDRVVSKDDLLEAIWGGRIVSDLAITTRINAVRRALSDDGAAQRLIRTFSRKGFRFIGEITEQWEVPPSGRYKFGAIGAIDQPSIAVLPFQSLSGRFDAGLFRIRYDRGDHYRALAHPLAGGYRAQFELRL